MKRRSCGSDFLDKRLHDLKFVKHGGRVEVRNGGMEEYLVSLDAGCRAARKRCFQREVLQILGGFK